MKFERTGNTKESLIIGEKYYCEKTKDVKGLKEELLKNWEDTLNIKKIIYGSKWNKKAQIRIIIDVKYKLDHIRFNGLNTKKRIKEIRKWVKEKTPWNLVYLKNDLGWGEREEGWITIYLDPDV